MKYFILLIITLFGTGVWMYQRNQEDISEQLGQQDDEIESEMMPPASGQSVIKREISQEPTQSPGTQQPQIYDAQNIAPLASEQPNTPEEYVPSYDNPNYDQEVSNMDVGPTEIYVPEEPFLDDEMNRMPANEN